MFNAARVPSRREFLRTGAAAALTVATGSALPVIAKPAERPTSETLVGQLYESFSDAQKRVVCFAWDHQDPRTRTFAHPHLEQLADHAARHSRQRVLHPRPAGHDPGHLRRPRQSRLARSLGSAISRRHGRLRPPPGHRHFRHARNATVRVRPERPARHHALRRQLRRTRLLRRPHPLRARRQRRLLRTRQPRRQRLLAPGRRGQPHLPNARRPAAPARPPAGSPRRRRNRLPRRRPHRRHPRDRAFRRPKGKPAARPAPAAGTLSPIRPATKPWRPSSARAVSTAAS